MVRANATCGMSPIGEREEFARGSRGRIGQRARCLCAYVVGHYLLGAGGQRLEIGEHERSLSTLE
jgi:hypothetical protein